MTTQAHRAHILCRLRRRHPRGFVTPGRCGKRRPPLPPVESVPQRTELLSGVQRGNQVILSWPAPLRNAPDGSVQSIRRIDVYRLAEPSDAPLPLTEEEFGVRATLIGSVPFAQIEQVTTGTLSYIDALELTEPVRLRYALRYVNDANQRAAFSNFLLIEPATRVSQPPDHRRQRNARDGGRHPLADAARQRRWLDARQPARL